VSFGFVGNVQIGQAAFQQLLQITAESMFRSKTLPVALVDIGYVLVWGHLFL
jgi:hypothetical protein